MGSASLDIVFGSGFEIKDYRSHEKGGKDGGGVSSRYGLDVPSGEIAVR